MKFILIVISIAAALFVQGKDKNVQLQFISLYPQPMIGKSTRGAESVRFGFEGAPG